MNPPARSIADTYRDVAATFSARVEGVPADRWDDPTPCAGWVARDVVRHLVDWLPALFFTTWELTPPEGPSVDDDPAGAWRAVDRTFQAALDDPAVATTERSTPMGTASLEATLAMIGTPDVLVHTWDLARATGQDEVLDPDVVHGLVQGMEPMDAALRASGHYGPRVPVRPDADEQTRLLAFMGREV